MPYRCVHLLFVGQKHSLYYKYSIVYSYHWLLSSATFVAVSGILQMVSCIVTFYFVLLYYFSHVLIAYIMSFFLSVFSDVGKYFGVLRSFVKWNRQ